MKTFAEYWVENFNGLRIKELDKRHVVLEDLKAVFNQLSNEVSVSEIGQSFENRPIHKLSIGHGPKNVLAWSCMHGNETTSLRGWMDFFVNQPVNSHFEKLLSEFTIHFIPMLNPDGAVRYTRRNAMGLDMNRDARALETPEMKLLVMEIDRLNPVLAFNLHDQRNIFAVNNVPATISFLAPSVDVERTVPPERAITMDLIGAAAKAIRPFINNGIGRYTDDYYPTAIGEFVQQKGIPTILVECGAAKNDPLRQTARMLNPIILHAILKRLSKILQAECDTYLNLPLNETNQVDIVVRDVKLISREQSFTADLAFLEELTLVDGNLQPKFKVNDFGDLRHVIGLEECFFVGEPTHQEIVVGSSPDFTLQTNNGALTFVNGVKTKAHYG